MPKLGFVVEFYDGQNQFRVPFIMYADFEAILEPIEGASPNPEGSYTSKVNQHIPSGFCVYSKFAYGVVQNPLKLYRGKVVLRSSAITSGREHIGCITYFLKNQWIL